MSKGFCHDFIDLIVQIYKIVLLGHSSPKLRSKASWTSWSSCDFRSFSTLPAAFLTTHRYLASQIWHFLPPKRSKPVAELTTAATSAQCTVCQPSCPRIPLTSRGTSPKKSTSAAKELTRIQYFRTRSKELTRFLFAIVSYWTIEMFPIDI